MWYHIPLPQSAKYLIGIACGGGIITILVSYVIPFHLHHAEILMPFAIANALSSGTLYAAAELALGYPAVVRLPWLGAGLGVATATVAPLLWPTLLPLCLTRDFFEMIFPAAPSRSQSTDGQRIDWLRQAYYELLLPVGIPVSLLAGAALQAVLVPLSTGMMSHPQGWTVVAAINACALGYYTICRSDTDLYWYERRTDKDGVVRSVNVKTLDVKLDGGALSRDAANKRHVFEVLYWVRSWVAWLTTSDLSSSPPLQGSNAVMLKIDLLRTSTATLPASATTPRAPSSSPSASSASPASLTLQVAQHRAELFPLLDALIRHKHLQQTGGASAGSLQGSAEHLRRQYGISDVGGFVVDCEAAVMGGPAAQSALQRLAEHSHSAVLLLRGNLPLLESEFRVELGYVVGGESSQKAVRDREWGILLRRVCLGAATLGVVGVGLWGSGLFN